MANRFQKNIFERGKLARGIATVERALAAGIAERAPQWFALNQCFKACGEAINIAGRDENSILPIHNFHCAADGRSHDGQTRVTRLDERDAETFAFQVRLAINIGGLEQRGDIRTRVSRPKAPVCILSSSR